MAVSTLTYNDVGRIVFKFDEIKFGATKPSGGPEIHSPSTLLAREHIVIHQLQNTLVRRLPLEIIDGIALQYLKSQPSVGTLLKYYVGMPYLRNRVSCLNQKAFLNGAAKELLIRLKLEPSKENKELVHFKQLMNVVFKEYFATLSLADKLGMIRKTEGTTWVIPDENAWHNANPFEKLSRLRERLQLHRNRWERAKIDLQVVSWKVQLAAVFFLKSGIFQVGILLGSAYGAYRVYKLTTPLRNQLVTKLAAWMGRGFEKIFETVLGSDIHAIRKPTWKELFFAMVVLPGLSIGVICLGIYSYMKLENRLPPPVRNGIYYFCLGLKAIVNPTEGLQMLVFEINRRADRWAESISRAAVMTAQETYTQEKLPHLLLRWNQFVLYPSIK